MATILSQTGKTFSFDKNFPLDTGSQTKQAEPSLQLASLLSDQPFKEMVTPKNEYFFGKANNNLALWLATHQSYSL